MFNDSTLETRTRPGKHHPRRPILAALLTAAVLAVTPLCAQSPGGPQPIATEQLGGTVLTVTPQIDYETAVLRVSGPDDYALTKRFAAGMPIVADLLAEGEPTEGAAAATADAAQPQATAAGLAEGLYHYEVVFTDTAGERQLYTGTFVVEGSGLVSRADKRIQLGTIRESLMAATEEFGRGPEIAEAGEPGAETTNVNDALYILDIQADDFTFARLDNASNDEAFLINSDGTLIDVAGGDIHLLSGGASMSLLASGQAGIGTTAPQQELHIDDTDGADILLSGTAAGESWLVGIRADTGNFVIQDLTAPSDAFRIMQSAADEGLVLAPSGVGVGTGSPEATLHVNGSGIIEGDVALGSSRTIKHEIEALDPAGVLAAIRELPVYGWKYRDDPTQSPHVGPMAEDVYTVFGVGRDEKHLSPADTSGLALAAIQGLDARLERELDELRARNTNLATENRMLRQRLEAIEKRLAE